MANIGAFLVQKWEDIDTLPIPASTAFNNGSFISYNGSGAVVTATPGTPIVGTNLVTVASTDPDYASTTKQTFYQKAGSVGQYRFIMGVGAGTAIASMIGKTFNVFTGAQTIDLSAYSTLTFNTLAVSTFAVGHTITGGTSSATGTITAINTLPNGSQQLVFTVTSGTFVSGETITDGTSSATAKILTVFTGGTQLKVENVLSTSLVEVTVALAA